jgi:predicted transcriptional regulator
MFRVFGADPVKARKDRQARATGRIPKALILKALIHGRTLTATALAFLGYRTTCVGNFAFNEKALLKTPILRGERGGRMSRCAIKATLKELRDAGILRRKQAPSRGRDSYSYATETLTLPPCGGPGTWTVARRSWYDGQRSGSEVGAFIYLDLVAGGASVGQLASYFGWSQRTARKVLNALVKIGWVVKEGRRYQQAESGKLRPTKNPKNGKLRPTKSGKLRPTHERPHERQEAALTSAAFEGARFAAAHEEKQAGPSLSNPAAAFFAARPGGCVVELLPVQHAAPGTLARVEAVAPDEVLRSAVRQVTGGRVADAVLRPPGLGALRQCAATLVTDERTPVDAVNALLKAAGASLRNGGKLFATALREEVAA